MRAILNKTVGPNFQAGDIIHGENHRIKKLVSSGVATADHSITGMFGCGIVWITTTLLILFSIYTFWAHKINGIDHRTLSALWRWTFIVLGIWVILKSTSQFFTGQSSYSAYYSGFIFSLLGGILIMAGHERATSRYQDRRTSSYAAIMLFGIGSICISMAIVSIVKWNIHEAGQVNDRITWGHFTYWLIWIIIYFVGYIIAKRFDNDFAHRRKRFIGFVKRKNVTIEYKTKALNYWRAYKETGNAEQFMEKNISLIEESLDVDRAQLIQGKKNKKQKKKY